MNYGPPYTGAAAAKTRSTDVFGTRRRYTDSPNKQTGQPAGFLFRATFATKDTLGDPNTVFVDSEGGSARRWTTHALVRLGPFAFHGAKLLSVLTCCLPGKNKGLTVFS